MSQLVQRGACKSYGIPLKNLCESVVGSMAIFVLPRLVMREFISTSLAGPGGYPFDMSSVRRPWPGQPQASVFGIALLIFALAALTSIIPASSISAHNVLHHLNFLPLMVAGILFGWRGALLASIFAAGVNLPLILRHWIVFPIDAKDQIVELSIFSAAGLIAGYLSDRERSHRRKLERTQEQLEQVYLELRENIAAMNKAAGLSAVGQLAASLAHEIRNPLASISGAAGILQRGSAQPEYLEDSLNIIQKESQRLNKLLTNFLNFAKPPSPRVQRVDANELLVSVMSLASHAAENRDIKLVQTSTLQDDISCDPEQLKQVLLNLVINAIEASPAGSEIRLSTLTREGAAMIEVADCGGGISDEVASHIFEPFFTTKPQGTGLGLAISSMIIAQHGGKLSFTKNARGGTTMRVELPASMESEHAH